MNLAYGDMKKVLLEKKSIQEIGFTYSSEIDTFVLKDSKSFKRSLSYKKISDYIEAITDDLELDDECKAAIDIIKFKLKGTDREELMGKLTSLLEKHEWQKIVNALVSTEQILARNFSDYKISFDHSQFLILLDPKSLI